MKEITIRFSKGLPEGKELKYPLTAIPKYENNLASPRLGKNDERYKDLTSDELKLQLLELLAVAIDVESGKFPHWYMKRHYKPTEVCFDTTYLERIPKPLGNVGASEEKPTTCSQMVRMDSPADLAEACVSYLLSKGYRPKKYKNVKHKEFIGNVQETMKEINEVLLQCLEDTFEYKWYHGTPRPEEVFTFLTGIKDVNITSYPEGCPTHPERMAGHGRVSGRTYSIIREIFEELKPEDDKEIFDSCFHFAHYRTFARVHYGNTNNISLHAGGMPIEYEDYL